MKTEDKDVWRPHPDKPGWQVNQKGQLKTPDFTGEAYVRSLCETAKEREQAQRQQQAASDDGDDSGTWGTYVHHCHLDPMGQGHCDGMQCRSFFVPFPEPNPARTARLRQTLRELNELLADVWRRL